MTDPLRRHGGARPGSGRKPKDGPKRVSRTVSMLPASWDALDAYVQEHGLRGRGEAVERLTHGQEPASFALLREADYSGVYRLEEIGAETEADATERAKRDAIGDMDGSDLMLVAVLAPNCSLIPGVREEIAARREAARERARKARELIDEG